MRWALLALAACSAPSQPDIRNTPPRVHGETPLVERGGMHGLTARHVPAISADGARIVDAVREPDGDRGLPNLTLVVKDRRDAEVTRHVVLSVAEADRFLDDAEGQNPSLDARVARANAWLDTLGFTAMRVLDPEATQVPADRTRATRDGVTIAWTPSHLRISDGATVLVDRVTPPTWLSGHCTGAAYLGAAAIARAHRIAVVTIAYVADSERCTAPADQHHVIVW